MDDPNQACQEMTLDQYIAASKLTENHRVRRDLRDLHIRVHDAELELEELKPELDRHVAQIHLQRKELVTAYEVFESLGDEQFEHVPKMHLLKVIRAMDESDNQADFKTYADGLAAKIKQLLTGLEDIKRNTNGSKGLLGEIYWAACKALAAEKPTN